MMKKALFLALLPLLLAATPHASTPWFDGEWQASGAPDVHYVPTPTEVVAEMLRLAEVGESDLVYDLGSGDGRIVITAAQDKGASGVGVDIDPVRVEEGRSNAAQAGVGDRVKFLQEDLFTIDFSDATVVTLYLLPDLNLRLRPRLLEELKPGTRIVSHAFHMGEWSPDEESSIGRHNVFFWIVPANVSGRWEWSSAEKQGEQRYELQITQDFQKVEGVLRSDAGLRTTSRANLRGDRVELMFDQGRDAAQKPLFFEGRIGGDVIEGTIHGPGGDQTPWRAMRESQTMSSLEPGR